MSEKVKLISFENGSQAIIRGSNVDGVSIQNDDEQPARELVLDVTKDQADDLRVKAAANEIDFDTIEENITNMNQTQTTPQLETEVVND